MDLIPAQVAYWKDYHFKPNGVPFNRKSKDEICQYHKECKSCLELLKERR